MSAPPPLAPPLERFAPSMLVLLGLVGALYGSQLGNAWLADDYLYLEKARQGLVASVRHVTVDSEPQMVRPWVGLTWWGVIQAGGAFRTLHALALLLHAFTSWQVLDLARKVGARPAAAWTAAVLFAACPVLGEGILWASSLFDLWAATWALLALRLAAEPRRGLWATLAFLLALASKESVLLLPAVLLLLPWDERRPALRLAAAWAGLLGFYLLGRWWLFGGIGGYQDALGERFALQVDVAHFLRNALLQIPFRLLLPIKDLAEQENTWLSGVFVGLGALLAWQCFEPKRWMAASPRLLALWLVALLPCASILSLDPHLGGGRLLYLPLAILAVGLAPLLRDSSRRAWVAAAILALAWSVISFAQARDWSRAAQHFHQTLATVQRSSSHLRSGQGVLLAGPENVRGIPVWLNVGYAFFDVELRRDVNFLIGSAAELEEPTLLGSQIDEIVVDPAGQPFRLTACQQALLDGPPQLIHELPFNGAKATPLLPLESRAAGIRLRGETPPRALTGRLWWRTAGRRFVAERSLRFRYRLDGSAVIRLPTQLAGDLAFLVALDDPRGQGLLRELEVLRDHEACANPPTWP